VRDLPVRTASASINRSRATRAGLNVARHVALVLV